MFLNGRRLQVIQSPLQSFHFPLDLLPLHVPGRLGDLLLHVCHVLLEFRALQQVQLRLNFLALQFPGGGGDLRPHIGHLLLELWTLQHLQLRLDFLAA